MNGERQILRNDLAILEKMVIELEPYLMNNAIRRSIAGRDTPKMSIGGCLMRQQRLEVMRDQLQKEEQDRLDVAIQQFNLALEGGVVRFECRAHQELHVRLGEWIGYFRCLTMYKGTKVAAARVARYASEVDTRVVIGALIDKLELRPYQLDQRIPEELATLDRSLRRRWQVGEFVWAPVWQPAYPHDRYWWLYGKPK